MPKNWDKALRLDEKNGNHYWRDVIEKEMKTVSIAYDPYHHETDGEISPNLVWRAIVKNMLLASNKLRVT